MAFDKDDATYVAACAAHEVARLQFGGNSQEAKVTAQAVRVALQVMEPTVP